jgi:thiol-disulfide isomerase/thioredoxin
MKLLVLSINLVFLLNACHAQNKKWVCNITYNLSHLKIDRGFAVIEIFKFQPDSVNNYALVKSIRPTKDIFTLAFKVNDPFMGYIQLKHHDSIYAISSPCILANENIAVDFFKKAITATKVASVQNLFYNENRFLFLALPNAIANEAGFSIGLIKRSYELSIPLQYYMLEAKLKEYEENVIKQIKLNKRYFFSVQRLFEIRNQLSPKTLDTCFSIVFQTFNGTSIIQKLQDYITQSKKLNTGKPVPYFKIADSNNVIKVSDSLFYQHDYTLIDFWASWCAPCRQSMKKIKSFYSNIDTVHFQIFSVSIDARRNDWIRALRQDSIEWRNYIDMDYKGWQGNVARTFNLSSIPSNIIVDKAGKIIAIDLSDEDLQHFLRKKKLYTNK